MQEGHLLLHLSERQIFNAVKKTIFFGLSTKEAFAMKDSATANFYEKGVF